MPFKKGNPGGAYKKGKKLPPLILRDLRWAYKHSGDEEKGTPQQMDFRQMYREDRKAFIDLLTRHEGMHRQKKPGENVPGGGGKDGGQGAGSPVGGEDADPGLEAMQERVAQMIRERAWEKDK